MKIITPDILGLSNIWDRAKSQLHNEVQQLTTTLTAGFKAEHDSRLQDQLTTMGLVVRSRDITAWDAMTAQERVTAVKAEFDEWTLISNFLATNL